MSKSPKSVSSAHAQAERSFITQLQHQALKQSYLQRYRWLPGSVDGLSALIGRHTLAFLLVTATTLMVVLQLFK